MRQGWLDLNNRLIVMGWVMFLLCGLLWIAQAAVNADRIGVLIGVIWVLGCGLFLWDLAIRRV